MKPITYEQNRHEGPVSVRLSDKIVGQIRFVAGGWQYRPNGQRSGGEVFPTLYLCKRSLEND